MSDRSAVVSKILEHLNGIYRLINQKKVVESLVVEDGKELLQPWPKKKVRKSKTTKDDCTREDDKKKKEDVERKEEEEMETKMLSEVEVMLAKAQQMRDVLAKTDQAKQIPRKKPGVEKKITYSQEKAKNEKRQTDRHAGSETPQSGVISQSGLSKLLANTSIKSDYTKDIKAGGATVKKERNPGGATVKKERNPVGVTVNKERVNKASGNDLKQFKSKPVLKIPPVTRKQYSTSASEIGKHSKRTISKISSSYSQKSLSAKSANERTKIGSANANREQSTVKSANERTRIHAANRQHASRGNRTAHNVQVLARKIIKNTGANHSNNNKTSTSVQHHTENDDVRSTYSDDVNNTEVDDVNSTGINDVNSTEVDDVKGYNCKPMEKSVRNTRGSQHGVEEDVVGQEEEEASFLLKTDGSKLKFPTHFRKLYNTQERLVNKVSEVMSRSGQTPECQHFLDRVNSKLLGASGNFSLYDHDMKYQRLKQEYQQLIQTADEQLLAIQQVSGESSWQDFYRIKVNMELIQDRSQQLLTEIKEFEQNEAEYCDIMQQARLKTLVANGRTNNLPSTFFLSPNNQGVLDDIFPQSFSQVKIEYCNLDELQRLVSLQLELQVLHVEQQTQKLLAEEILPVLAAMDKSDPAFIQSYRSLYGLLCHHGEQFPTMIDDDVDEAESESPDYDY